MKDDEVRIEIPLSVIAVVAVTIISLRGIDYLSKIKK